MKYPLSRLCILLALVLALHATTAFGQAVSTGALAGTVTDPNGGAIANATVVVRSDETGQEFTTQTSDNGTFNVPALASGIYTVTVTSQGFKRASVQRVKVDVGTPSSVQVALEVGAPEETVTVVGGGELLQTQTANVGTTITGRQITDLPFSSRDALDLVTLLPGTSTVGRPRASSVNGLPKGALVISIDGTDAQDNLLRSQDGFFTFIRPRIDAIDEVTVSTATPGAESSGDGAVQIKFVTRGGTNEFHGSAYWYHRNPAVNANYWYNNALLPPDPRTGEAPHTRILLNQYGVRAGGPIRIPKIFDGRDKAFFFVNYEEYRLPEQAARTRTILSPLAQTGIFQYTDAAGVLRSVNLLTLAAANGLPSTIDPTVGSLLSAIRTSVAQGGVAPVGGQPNFQQFSYNFTGGQKRYFPTVRFDFNIGKNHHIENIWNYQVFRNGVDFLNNAEPSFPGFPNFGGQDSNRWSNTTAWRATITPTLVNEARLGLVGGISLFRGDITGAQFANQGGFNLNFNGVFAPFFGVNSSLTNITAGAPFNNAANLLHGISTAGSSNNRRNSPTQEFTDNLTWVKGSHTFTFGGQYKRINLFSQSVNEFAPYVNFGIDATDTTAVTAFNNNAAGFPGASANLRAQAGALYALLTGRVTLVSGTAYLSEGENQRYTFQGLQTQRVRQNEYGLYAQDSWRWRPNLTINYGLRWQVQEPFTAVNNVFSTTSSFNDVFGISGAGNVNRPGVMTGQVPTFVAAPEGYQPYKTDWNNFAPSFGIVWSPDWKTGLLNRAFGNPGQTVLRAGYSIAYVREGTNVFAGVTGTNPGGLIDASRGIGFGGAQELPVGTLLRNPAALAPAPFPAAPAYPLVGTVNDSVNVFDPNLKTAYVQSWTAGIQRELTKDIVVEARYVGNRGVKLWRQYNINELNVIENGFAPEFQLAQANLLANRAAGRGNTFAFFGPGTGTQPLPIMLSYFRGPTAANNLNPNNPAQYTSALFTNAGLVGALSPIVPNVRGFATTVNGSAARRANAMAAGLPENFFLINPTTLGGSFLVDNGARSWYDAFVLELRKRMSDGLLIQGSYSFSKSLTDIYAVSSVVFQNYASIRNPSLSKTYSPFDVRHNFKVNWLYELPFGKGRQFLSDSSGLVDRLLGGWEMHGAARWQSGAPVLLGNVSLVGMTREELENNIDVRKLPNGVVTWLPDDIIQNTIRAFNPDVTSATGFSANGVPTGRFIAPAAFGGCVQRFTGECGFSNLVIHGPKFFRLDVNVVKKIRFTENTNLELRAEFLNALNNLQWRIGGWAADAPTVANFAAATFGQLPNGSAYQDTSTTNDPGGRLVQFVLRFNF